MVIAIIQGIYYIATGLWAVLHLASFEKVTGPKTDKWLVKAMGLLFVSIGVVLVAATSPELQLLAILVAASVLFIDVYYVTKGVIRKIYLLDAAVHAVLLVAWLVQYLTY